MLRTGYKSIRFCLIFAQLLTLRPLQGFEDRIRESNRAYQQGDWITIATTRFVRYITFGHTFVYCATTGGITRINRFTYKWDFPWTTSNGLPDNDIFLVAFDFNTGYLWAVTQHGISYLEPASQMWYNAFYDEMNMFNQYITSIGIGDDRQNYVVTSDNRWFVSDNTSARFNEIDPLTSDDFIRWYGAKENRSRSLPNFFMDGGYLFDSRQQYIDDLLFRHWQITTWIRDDWNNLWLGTWGLGVGRGDLTTQRLDLLEFGLWDDVVDDIAVDQQSYWIAGVQDHNELSAVTEWRGMTSEPTYFEPHLITGFASDQIASITSDEQFVWFGTRAGLVMFDKHNNRWKTYNIADRLANDYIHKVNVDESFVWVATASGVSKLHTATVYTDSVTIGWVDFPSHRIVNVYDMAHQGNLLWMATEFGVYVYNKESETGGYYIDLDETLLSRQTYAIDVYGDEVWFGSDLGVFGFNAAINEWLDPPAKMYETEAGINRIKATYQAVWVATNQGVLKFDREQQRWVSFTTRDGLADDRVYAIQLDGDFIYFGTSRGLTRFYWNNPFRND